MPRRGFTIIELLVVIALIALLAGLSAGAFLSARRNFGLAATAAEVQAILRAARNTSISSGTPSFVVVDPVKRQIWAQSFETAGEWSFESEDDARLLDAALVEGRVGRGVSFRGSSGYADCGSSPRFDLKSGLVIEAWIRHDMAPAVAEPTARRESRPRSKARTTKSSRLLGSGSKAPRDGRSFVIVERIGSFAFELTEYGALIGVIGDHEEITEDDVVAPGRWVFVSMRFDGSSIVLEADGVDRATWPLDGRRGADLPEEIPATTQPLTISSPDASFPGEIDEVRLRGRAEKLVYEHNADLRVLGWKRRIHFDRRGHLDAAYHDGKARIVLIELSDEQFQRTDEKPLANSPRERRKDRVTGVPDYSLMFEEWLGSMPEDYWPDEDEAEILRKLENGKYRDARKVVIEIDRLGVMR